MNVGTRGRVVRRAWRCAIVAALTLLPAGQALAGVYKWKDADGNVQFSDRPPPAAAGKEVQGEVKQIEIAGSAANFQVPTRLPIRNPDSTAGASIALTSFRLQLDASNGRNVTIGRAFGGRNCETSVEMQWNEGFLDLKGKIAEVAVADRFTNWGYRFIGSDGVAAANLADRRLESDITVIRIDTCSGVVVGNAFAHGARAYVKLRWRLKGADGDDVLFEGASAGVYDGWHSGASAKEALIKAISSATDNLLGDTAFVESLVEGSVSAKPSVSTTPNTASASYGSGGGSFRTHADALMRGALTVRTVNGHGSGVIIDAAGFALTNAHVVGADAEVSLMIGGKRQTAQVVRRDRSVDVALLKFDTSDSLPVVIARAEPRAGDPLYVVGTPLSEALEHTVTQGIMSAVRDVDGRRLYQTDAAVNPGNSGGPVFNESGELVALSVGGLVNAQGGSVNVNYLIPIEIALRAVGIAAK